MSSAPALQAPRMNDESIPAATTANNADPNSSGSPTALSPTKEPTSSASTRTSKRSRKGCQTCRRRKVKCDETIPACAHCRRLHLTCVYQSAPAKDVRFARGATPSTLRTNGQSSRKSPTWIGNATFSPSASTSKISPNNVDNLQGNSSIASIGNGSPQNAGYDLSMSNDFRLDQSVVSNDDRTQRNGPSDLDSYELEILGEDSLWGNIPIFSDFLPVKNSDFYDFMPIYNAPTVRTAFDTSNASSIPQTVTSALDRTPIPANGTQTPQGHGFNAMSAEETVLLRHFVDFAVPPILVGVEPRWHNARDALLRVSKSSALARHAICAFSSLSLGEPSPTPEAPSQSSRFYYGLAMGELRDALDEQEDPGVPTKESQESILAGIFFLAYIDLMTSITPQSSLDLLKRAHVLLNSKSAGSPLLRQLQIWLKLLDAKAVSAGGEGIHLRANYPSASTDDERSGPEEVNTSIAEVEDILFSSLNRTAYDFYLQVLNFSGRIAGLDKWHRPRGSVQDELDVMLAADKIVKDLNALWTRRPAIIDLADKSSELRLYMTSPLAIKIGQHLRTYTANFSACYIHLQRVAYVHMQTTAQAKEAVAKIVNLCRLMSQEGQSLPASMLWPLMMAACEVEDQEMQIWLIGKIEDMNSQVGNANRTADLVREIVKRQRSGNRADARTVMHETFGTVFAIM